MTLAPTPDTEITIACAHQRAVLSPWGASLRRYVLVDGYGRETDIVWGYSGAGQKKGGQGDVLIPFPGRVADGRYSFDGQALQLERNDRKARMPYMDLCEACRGRCLTPIPRPSPLK